MDPQREGGFMRLLPLFGLMASLWAGCEPAKDTGSDGTATDDTASSTDADDSTDVDDGSVDDGVTDADDGTDADGSDSGTPADSVSELVALSPPAVCGPSYASSGVTPR